MAVSVNWGVLLNNVVSMGFYIGTILWSFKGLRLVYGSFAVDVGSFSINGGPFTRV